MGPQNEEREMTIHQRGLVDTCFEEGQYGSAIAVLDQLRSPIFRPPAQVPDHVRQLLYIALFPPTPDQIPPSPLKGSPPKHKPALSRLSLAPSVADSAAAQRVLLSFLATNSPRSLLRALPRYPLDDVTDDALLRSSSDNSHDQDSPISRESLCIGDCRHCWAILRDGFIQRKKLVSQDARKQHRRAAHDVDDAGLDQAQDRATPAVVAEHAWPVLQWLLSLFEKDESFNSRISGERFSPLLLSQIPPPRRATGPRWEAGAPLDIVFHALTQDDGERRDMAIRLLALLVNLSLSRSFDGPMFAATVTTRLYSSSPQIAQNLMESLPKTIPALTFKITVCQKFLSSSPSVAGGTKPRPRPLPRRGTQYDVGTMSSATDVDVGRAGSGLLSRPALVPCAEVFRLLCREHASPKSTSEPPVPTIKYALLVSYAHLQTLLPREEKDDDWKRALSNGRLNHVIDIAFAGDSTYRRALAVISSVWSAT